MVRESGMCREPPICLKLGILELLLRLPVHGASAGRGVIAERALVLVRRPDELSLYDQIPQISQHGLDCWSRWSFDPDTLQAPFPA